MYHSSNICLNIYVVPNDSFFMYRIEKNISFWIFFPIQKKFFSSSTPTAKKLDDGILVALF